MCKIIHLHSSNIKQEGIIILYDDGKGLDVECTNSTHIIIAISTCISSSYLPPNMFKQKINNEAYNKKNVLNYNIDTSI